MSIDDLPIIENIYKSPLPVAEKAEITENGRKKMVYIAGITKRGILIFKSECYSKLVHFDPCGLTTMYNKFMFNPSFRDIRDVMPYIPLKKCINIGLSKLPKMKHLMVVPFKVLERAEISFKDSSDTILYHHKLGYVAGITEDDALIYDSEATRIFKRRQRFTESQNHKPNVFYNNLLIENPLPFVISKSHITSYSALRPVLELISIG